MKVRFVLTHGTVVEWSAPANVQLDFHGLCKAIRADGHFMAPDVYIPHEQITMIGLVDATSVTITVPPGTKPN